MWFPHLLLVPQFVLRVHLICAHCETHSIWLSSSLPCQERPRSTCSLACTLTWPVTTPARRPLRRSSSLMGTTTTEALTGRKPPRAPLYMCWPYASWVYLYFFLLVLLILCPGTIQKYDFKWVHLSPVLLSAACVQPTNGWLITSSLSDALYPALHCHMCFVCFFKKNTFTSVLPNTHWTPHHCLQSRKIHDLLNK